MKTFRKIEISNSQLNHEEMKSIKAGYYGGYACNMSTSGSNYSCSSYASSCMTASGSTGYCAITISSGPYSMSCSCE